MHLLTMTLDGSLPCEHAVQVPSVKRRSPFMVNQSTDKFSYKKLTLLLKNVHMRTCSHAAMSVKGKAL